MDRVFVCHLLPEDLIDPLNQVAEVLVWPESRPIPRVGLFEEVANCVGLLTMLTTEVDQQLLEAAPRLRVVSQMAVGVDNIDVAACRDLGIRIGHTPDVLTETVADTAFALMAAIVRRLPEGERVVRAGEWGPWDPWSLLGGDLHGVTLGIIGMGRIGSALARRAKGFDMRVVFYSRSSKKVAVAIQMPLDDLLGVSDIVVVAIPLTDETRGLIGSAELQRMRPGAYLVNVSRGGLVDTDALVDALGSQAIAGAALDVTDPEPLPPDHPLLSLANCLVVPHIGSASVSARRAMADLAVRNLVAGLAGDPMPAELPVEGESSAADYPARRNGPG